MSARTINTESFEFSHGRKPRGEGYWLFENTAGDTVELTGPYSQVVKQLPAGSWKVLP
ncbi:hypothetical protein [Microtetraspora malaysiensis]|uniref:Uncharacterized protein n=1 Tax=Microtetraspora malaysiensis TaxID=161358 RepID=A0ABW6SKB3_9ACTN